MRLCILISEYLVQYIYLINYIIIYLDVLSEGVRRDFLYEILYADDLVIMADSLQDLESKYRAWKNSLENKGLRVNVEKTKIMVGEGRKVRGTSNVDPCSVCGMRVKRNSIRCNRCRFWVHARCSGVKGGLSKVERTFICKKCGDGGGEGGTSGEKGEKGREVKVFDGMEVVENFCYLGDTIQRDGGCDLAVRERVRKGWMKFRELF